MCKCLTRSAWNTASVLCAHFICGCIDVTVGMSHLWVCAGMSLGLACAVLRESVCRHPCDPSATCIYQAVLGWVCWKYNQKRQLQVCCPGNPSPVGETDLSPDSGGSTGNAVRPGAQGTMGAQKTCPRQPVGCRRGLPGGGDVWAEM